MSDDRHDMPPEIRASLDLIRRTLANMGATAPSDLDAVEWAVASHAACIARECIVAEPAVFRALLLRHLHTALADMLDVDPRELALRDDGETVTVDFVDEGREAEAEPVRPHVH